MSTKPWMPLLAALLWVGLAGVLPGAEAWSTWVGSWRLSIGQGGFDKSLKCGYRVDRVVKEFKVKLTWPDTAVDEFGNVGHWTSVFDWGVEVVVQGRKFYSVPWKRWDMNDAKSPHYFNSTEDLKWWWRGMAVGWSHDLFGNNWACFYGSRVYGEGEHEKEEHNLSSNPLLFQNPTNRDELLKPIHELVREINEGQLFWEAEKYPEFANLTKEQMQSLAGGKYSQLKKPHVPAPATEAQRNESKLLGLPTNWDWRNVNGKNYVTPVRNQGYRCGSCYAFASAAMQESRVRILTNNKVASIYSPQDIVDCSPYAFGCWGGLGFPEGKYAEEFGYAEESCSTYQGYTNQCTSQKCKRSYSTDYEFIGTHTGGCNELAMQIAIYRNGPIVADFLLFLDFFYYRSGIYYHYGRNWCFGFHSVTVVGWGEDPQTETKYWIVKNSWGTRWGENGYFRIIRGVDECWFESSAWQATPIL